MIKLNRKIIDVKKNERDIVVSRFCYRIKKIRERRTKNFEFKKKIY